MSSKYLKYYELIMVLLIAEQQNEVRTNDHSTWHTSSTAMPEAHASVAKNFSNHIDGRGKGKWKGEGGAMFKGKGKRKPKGKRESKVTCETSE
jgi:hypothetical protein